MWLSYCRQCGWLSVEMEEPITAVIVSFSGAAHGGEEERGWQNEIKVGVFLKVTLKMRVEFCAGGS